MPIYEYECQACGERIEKFQKISDDPITLCPNCGAEKLQKLVSASAFKLTGSGWYETDFKDKKPKTTDKTDSKKPESATASSSSPDKSESKPKKPKAATK